MFSVLIILVLSDMMLVRFHLQKEKEDTLSLKKDNRDSLSNDSLIRIQPFDTVATRRLSPTELRDSRKVERSIHVVKEKPYHVIRRSSGNGNRTHR